MLELDHTTLYVADVARCREFYAELLGLHDYRLNRDFGEHAAGLGPGDYAVLALVRADGPIRPTHLAFRLPSRGDVDALYESALSRGARDNGPPGLRPHYHATYYAAFVLDPEGNNLEFVCHEPPS